LLLQKKRLNSFKPGVDRRVHLLAAAFLWAVVGLSLLVRGWIWMEPAENCWFLVLAVALGILKSALILDRAARKGVERITRLRDGTCLGAVYSWKTWLLVGIMVTSGILLRMVYEPGKYVGTLYFAVGLALMLSSRFAWAGWARWMRRDD